MLRTTAFVLGLALAGAAHAQLLHTTYDTGQMPSAQGWSYYSLNSALTTESQVFSTASGVTTSNTIGNGYQGQGGNFAYLSSNTGQFTAGQNWMVEARVRVLQGELWSFHYGFCIGASFDGMIASVGIMPSTWQDASLNGWTRDNTQWTTWRVQTDRENGVFHLYADGTLLATRALTFGTQAPAFPEHYTFFGDGTGGANARAEMSSFTFAQLPVPTPGALAVLGASVMFACRRRR